MGVWVVLVTLLSLQDPHQSGWGVCGCWGSSVTFLFPQGPHRHSFRGVPVTLFHLQGCPECSKQESFRLAEAPLAGTLLLMAAVAPHSSKGLLGHPA